MSDKEILDGAEKALDVIEKRLDALDGDISNWYYFDKPAKVKMGIALGMIGAGIAIAAGTTSWLLAKKKITKEANEHLEEQIRLTKDHYQKRAKDGDYSSPAKAAVALGHAVVTDNVDEESDLEEPAARAMRDYRAVSSGPDPVVEPTTETEIAEAADPEVKVEVNVFTQAMDEAVWDQDKEEAWRASLRPGDPYIISEEEFLTSEKDYNQTTMTYYSGDNVLTDAKDEPIDLVDMVVGEGNIRFGYGSNDPRTVYIRNDRLEQDFEVTQSDGKYAHEVLGLQHSDERGSRQRDRHERRTQNRKFRDGDD